MLEERYLLDVTLGSEGDSLYNTIVLSGIDLEIPLEADLDGDPLHDDQVRLEGVDGSLRVLTVGDPEVRLDLDRRLYLYRFHAIPNGIYSLSVKLSDGTWATILSGIRVTKTGALLGGQALTEQRIPAVPPDSQPEPEEPPEQSNSTDGDTTPFLVDSE